MYGRKSRLQSTLRSGGNGTDTMMKKEMDSMPPPPGGVPNKNPQIVLEKESKDAKSEQEKTLSTEGWGCDNKSRIVNEDNAHSTVHTPLADAADHAAGEGFGKVGFGDPSTKTDPRHC